MNHNSLTRKIKQKIKQATEKQKRQLKAWINCNVERLAKGKQGGNN